jgi:integrase
MDLSRAKAAPGVLAIVTAAEAGKLTKGDFNTAMLLGGPEIQHYHQAVAVVVAETFEQARAAANLVKVDYVRAKGTFDLASAKDGATKPKDGGPDSAVGDFDAAFALPFNGAVHPRDRVDDWRATDLQSRVRADGKRTGRIDCGQYVFEQFTRHLFPSIGEMVLAEVSKADLLALLDAQKSAGKMRTANVLLADIKQMLDFALEREIIDRNPLATVKKSKVGGPSVERDRVLSEEEIRLLTSAVGGARMNVRSATAIWLTLATGVRVGELMGAIWTDALPVDSNARKARLKALQAVADAEGVKLGIVDTAARTWYMPTTKNQRDHSVHLSEFAIAQIEVLNAHREALISSTDNELTPWLFPATDNHKPVCVKSFGKQLSDRQREPEQRLNNRTRATTTLMLPGGKWTAHDLRRTAATVMARCGFGSDTINECLNHIQADRMARVYIQDRREADQRRAFDALGQRLTELTTGVGASNVVPLRVA